MNRVKKVKSFERFSDDLWAQRPELIVVQADVRPAISLFGTSKSLAVGGIGDYKHGLVYTVFDNEKQKRHIEPLFTRFQSEYGFADSIDRYKRFIQVVLAGEVRVEQLSEMLPESEVYLGGLGLRPSTEAVLDNIHEEAQRLDIEPADFVV